jgi:hypothetical protein
MRNFRTSHALLLILVLLVPVLAVDWTADTLSPQVDDNGVLLEKRQAAALSQIASSGVKLTDGTNQLSFYAESRNGFIHIPVGATKFGTFGEEWSLLTADPDAGMLMGGVYTGGFQPAMKPLKVDADGTLRVNTASSEAKMLFFQWGTQTSAGFPARLYVASLQTHSIKITARRNVSTANTGNVYIQFSDDNTEQNKETLAPGDVRIFTAAPGKYIDPFDIYVDVATTGDGVICTFEA